MLLFRQHKSLEWLRTYLCEAFEPDRHRVVKKKPKRVFYLHQNKYIRSNLQYSLESSEINTREGDAHDSDRDGERHL